MCRAAQYQGSVSSEVLAGGTRFFTLDGEFDLSSAAEFERRLSEASEPEPADIVVDLRAVSFVDSTMLKVLLRALMRVRGRGPRFALVRPNALVSDSDGAVLAEFPHEQVTPGLMVFVLSGLSDEH